MATPATERFWYSNGQALLQKRPRTATSSLLAILRRADDSNDVTSGYNAHGAMAGYDLVTGLMTPVA